MSLPMRGRGLKLSTSILSITDFNVAPHAGAWIEIIYNCTCIQRVFVAPHAGAWIEIARIGVKGIPRAVAPHAGAWIEMISPILTPGILLSLPMRGRGLK